MKGGSEPDDLFKGLKNYFDANYDFLKDNDWFESLSYHIQDMYSVNPYEESLLDTICIIVALTYVKLKSDHEDEEDDEVDELFMELLNNETGLHFPLDANSGKLHRRMYVDFLNKLYEYSKKHMDTGGIQFEMGPSGKPRLADSSFKPSSLLKANERWYKRTLDDGRRVWTPTKEYEGEEKNSKYYAKSSKVGADEPLDVNLVGKFSQGPRNKNAVTSPKDEIKKRLDMIQELKDEYNVGSSDEGIYKVADKRLESQGIVTGIKGRQFDMSKFVTVATSESSMEKKVKRIKSKASTHLRKYVPYALERLILEIDMGHYGKLDVEGPLEFEYIKERTKYQRLKKGLDVYEGDKKGLGEVQKTVREIYKMNLEGIVGVGQGKNDHYDNMDITPFHAEELHADEVLGDVHLNLKALQECYTTLDAFTNNVNTDFEDIFSEYKRSENAKAVGWIFVPTMLNNAYRSLINNMDDLLMQHYTIINITKLVYEEGVFSTSTLGELHGHGVLKLLDEKGVSWRDGMLRDEKVIAQRLKVVELEFYERFLNHLFGSFSWENLHPLLRDDIPPLSKEIIMELFAHAEILREQLHPTKGNPPLIILPHLRQDPEKRFKFYDYKILNIRKREEKNALKIIEHIIFLNGEVFKILQGNELYMRIFRAFKDKDVDALYDIGVERMTTQNPLSKLKENVEKYKKLDALNKLFIEDTNTRIKENEEEISGLFSEIMVEVTADTEKLFEEYINERDGDILDERKENVDDLLDILSRVYGYVTGGDVEKTIRNADIAGLIPYYNFIGVMKKMKRGDTSDVEYKYKDLDSEDPKGDEIVDEDEFVDEWLERKVYRESIKQNKPDYVQKQIEEYNVESDPFGLKPKDRGLSANVPTLREMDEKQRLRTFKWRGDGELDFITGDKILDRQKQELYDSGRGEYLTAQPAFSKSIRKGSLISNIKRLNKEIMISDKPRNHPKNVEKSKKVISMYRELEGMDEKFLKRGPTTKTPKDMKGLKKGVYKSTPQNINTIKGLLNKSGYDMVSEFASVIDPSLEGYLGEDEERFGDPEEPIYEREMKKALIEEITKKLEEESLDDSDVVEMEQQKLDIYNHGKVVEIIESMDIDSLMDLTYSLFNKYKQYLSNYQNKEKQEKLNMLGLLELQGEEEEIRKVCGYVILEIIRDIDMDKPLKEKGAIFDYNDIFQYTPVEYKLAELNDSDNPVIDQYGEPVVDYQNIRSVNPTDFMGKQAEELMGYDLIGKRHGENVYSEKPLYRKSETVREPNVPERVEGETFAEYEKRKTRESGYTTRWEQGRGRWGSNKPTYNKTPETLSSEGGGRRRTQRKRTPQRKRTQRKRTQRKKK